MLETLRAASKSWVAAILIGLLILSFAIWGINDIFTTRSATWVAKVNGTEIETAAFQDEFLKRIRRQPGEDGRPLTAAAARAAGYDRIILESMISDIAVLDEAKKQGISASDAMVLAAIADYYPGMVGSDGKFIQARLDQVVYEMGVSRDAFVQLIREDVMRRTLLLSPVIDLVAPRGIAAALQAYDNERRAIDYIVLPVEKAGEIPAPDDAALQAFMEANADLYTAPELRAITLLSVGPDDLMPGIEIPEEEIKAQYEAGKKAFETLEKRELEQIVYDTKEEAEAARKELDGGKTFEDLAAARKLSPEDVKIGVIEKGSDPMLDGAFTVAEGEVSQPLETAFGWALVKVVKIEPGSVKTYEEVREEVRTELARGKAIDKIDAARDQIDDALAGNNSLEGAAEALKGVLPVKVTKIPALDAQGNDADGKPLAGLPDGPAFLRDVFLLDQGEKSDAADTPGHVLYVIQADAITPPALRKLDDRRADVTAAWTMAEQAKRLKTLADDTVKAANAAGTATEDLAQQLGLDAKTSGLLSREAPNEEMAPPLIADLFKVPVGTWVSGLGVPPTMVVARVKEIGAEAPADFTAQARDLRRTETRAIGQDLAEAYRQAIVAAADVQIDESQFQKTQVTGQ